MTPMKIAWSQSSSLWSGRHATTLSSRGISRCNPDQWLCQRKILVTVVPNLRVHLWVHQAMGFQPYRVAIAELRLGNLRDRRRAVLATDMHGWASRHGNMASVHSSGPPLWHGQYITLLGSRLNRGDDIDDLQWMSKPASWLVTCMTAK
jgi:hypothetical protein